jgi:hypothetical protein
LKTLPAYFAFVILGMIVTCPRPAPAQGNPYDVFAKVLMPFVNVLAKNSRDPNKAFIATLELEDAKGLEPETRGARLEIAFQAPNKLKLRGPVMGEIVTVCRKGQRLWASPGPKLAALLDAAGSRRKLPAADPKFELAPFSLPFPEKQLVFMPALFRVQAGGQEEIAGEVCQVIDVQLMPELERSLKGAKGWSARVWARPDGKLAQIKASGPEISVTVRVLQLQFAPSLAKDTWSPSPGEEVLEIAPSRYDQLVRALLGGKADSR